MVTRRAALQVIGGGLATMVGSPFSLASANEAIDSDRIEPFYLSITEQAFNETYGDRLSPENIGDLQQLGEVVIGDEQLYRANLLSAATEYFEALSPEAASSLLDKLNNAPDRPGGTERNLLSAIRNDVIRYERGRNISPETTNPLFYAIKTLQEEGVVTESDAMSAIYYVRNLTHGMDVPEGEAENNFTKFHNELMGRVQPIVENKQNPVPSPGEEPALKNPFN
jgi:hypothetical protein